MSSISSKLRAIFRRDPFTLNGVYRVDQLWPVPGATCDLCLRIDGYMGVPAVTRQIEYGGDVPASLAGRAATLVDSHGKPLALTQETGAVKNKFQHQRGLCKRHMVMVTEDALRRGLMLLRYDKARYDSLNEIPPEWRETYAKLQVAKPAAADEGA